MVEKMAFPVAMASTISRRVPPSSDSGTTPSAAATRCGETGILHKFLRGKFPLEINSVLFVGINETWCEYFELFEAGTNLQFPQRTIREGRGAKDAFGKPALR
jgi:hypothetical protein